MNLKQHAAADGFERAMFSAGWAAGIGVGVALVAAIAVLVIPNPQVAGQHVHFFPVLMHERNGRVDARVKPEQARAAAGFCVIVNFASEDLLLDPVWIARRRCPAFIQVRYDEFQVFFFDSHSKYP